MFILSAPILLLDLVIQEHYESKARIKKYEPENIHWTILRHMISDKTEFTCRGKRYILHRKDEKNLRKRYEQF